MDSTHSKGKFARLGLSWRGIPLIVIAILSILLGGWLFVPQVGWSSQQEAPLEHEVEEGEFVHEIVERGNVESASNVEIRCEVKMRGKSITILEIVPEGTYVEPGQVLVKLDSSSLESDLTQQEIVCANSEAAKIKAENDYETAIIALKEYKEGTYVQDRLKIDAAIQDKTREWSQAKEFYKYSQMLERKGYLNRVQVEADEAQVAKAAIDKLLAETDMKVLEEFTKEKTIKQLESDIKTTKATYDSKEASHRLDKAELALIKEQIENCIIKATDSGQVVYANETDRRGGQEIIIEPGLQVRERQTLIRLPDPKRMQVKANINEAKVNLVAVNQQATIRLDAFPDVNINGTVTKVDEYPAPSGWFSSNVKEYGTYIAVENESVEGKPVSLRPGLTAEVRILVEFIPKAITVPVQAVIEHGGKHYCLLWKEGKWEAREVEIGSTNDTMIVVRKGLAAGEKVVLNANGHRDDVSLPRIEEEANNQRTRPRAMPVVPAAKKPEPGSAEAARPGGSPGAPGTPGSAPGAPGGAPGAPGGPPGGPDALFAKADTNGDGKLQEDELPERMRPMLQSADKDKDGALSKAEMSAAMNALRAGGGAGVPGGGGGPGGGPGRPSGGRP